MPASFLVEGIGEIGPDVIYGEDRGTKLYASAGPTPNPSTIVVRDLGTLTPKSFIAGKRVTVAAGGAPSSSKTFFDGFSIDDPATWPTWNVTPGYPQENNGATVTPSVSTGHGRLDFTWLSAVGPGFSNSFEDLLRDLPADTEGASIWRLTAKVQIPTPDLNIQDELFLGVGDSSWGIDLFIWQDGASIWHRASLNGFGSFASYGATPGWDDTEQYIELDHQADGTLEFRMWPVSGSRPASPDLSAVDSPPTALGPAAWIEVYADAGSGLVSINEGDAGSTEYAFDSIAFDYGDPGIPPIVIWAGYLLKASRQFWFDVDKPDTMNRRWVLSLVDVSTLFQKRVAFKQSAPGTVQGPVYKTDAYDNDLIAELVSHWLDLSTDDLDVTSLIDRVGIVNPSVTCAAGQAFYPWNGGSLWGEAMEAISQVPAAIYGFVPAEPLGSSPFARLFYADVDSADAPLSLTDLPFVRGSPAATLLDDPFTRTTTAPTVGNGWSQNPDATGAFVSPVPIYCDGSELVLDTTDPLYNRAGYSRNDVDCTLPGYAQFDFYVPALVDQQASQGWQMILDGARSHPAGFGVQPKYPLDGTWFVGYMTSFGSGSGQGSMSAFGFTPLPGTWYTVKGVFTPTTLGVKVWQVGTTEPGGYNVGPVDISGIAPFGEPDVTLALLNGAGSVVSIKADTVLIVRDAIADVLIPNAGRYRECTIWDDFTDPINEEFAWGAGLGGGDKQVFSHRSDATSITDHGRWQRGDSLLDVWCQDTIDAISNAVVNGSPSSRRGHKKPARAVDLVTYEPGLRIGQKIRFVNNDYGVDQVLPARSVEITFPTPNTMKQLFHLSEALDRWGFQDPQPPFRSYTDGGPGQTTTPTPIQTVVCIIDIAPVQDIPGGWGDQWGSGHEVDFPNGFPDYPSGITDQTYLGTPHVSGVNPPAIFALGGVLHWTWEPVVSVNAALSTQGRTALIREATVNYYEHIHAVFAVTLGSSDETGDIADSIDGEFIDPTLNRGTMAWNAYVALHINGISPTNGHIGVKLHCQTGAAFMGTHVPPRPGEPPGWYEEPSVRFKVGAVAPMSVDIGPAGFVSPDTYPNLGGILTIDGDPTQVTVSFLNIADSTLSTETFLASDYDGSPFSGPGVFSYNNELHAAISGGVAAADGDGTFGRRAMLRHYAFSLVQSEFKLWTGDEPPGGVICGPVYSSDLTPLPTTSGLTECETPTKTSSTGYMTAFSFQPASLTVRLNGLLQRPSVDYSVTGLNAFAFTSLVDPTENVVVCYVTA